CRSRIDNNIEMGVIPTEDSIQEVLMSCDALQESYNNPFAYLLKKFYNDNRLIVDNTGHPITLKHIHYLLIKAAYFDDQIKRSRQDAIDEVSRDLVDCSPTKFRIKCKKNQLTKMEGTSGKENDGYVMSTAAKELFDDWVIDQSLEEYDYRFLEDIMETSKASINNLEKEQEEEFLMKLP
ncbi:10722_t:CDS:2, partial [Funneliformis geosporum]